jgi:hypothetical protein
MIAAEETAPATAEWDDVLNAGQDHRDPTGPQVDLDPLRAGLPCAFD